MSQPQSKIEIPEGSPIAIIVGNPAASFNEDTGGFVVRDQLVAVREALQIAKTLKDDGRRVRLNMMLDHRHHKKEGQVQKRQLLDPDKGLSRDASRWPTLNLMHEDIRKVFRGLVTRFDFNLRDVRVLPEESIFWYMDGQLRAHRGFPDYKLEGTDRSLYHEVSEGVRSPRCIAIFAGTFLASMGLDFELRSREKFNFRAIEREEKMPVVACFQKDGQRVTRSLVEQAQKFLISEAGYGIDPKMISVSLSDEATVAVRSL